MKKANSGAIRRWSEDRGFYMVLLLCVLAVAVAAYVLFAMPQTAQADPKDGYLYEADESVSASEPLERVPAMETTPEQKDESEEDDSAQQPAEPEEQPAKSEKPAAQQETPRFTPPMDADVTRAFSGDTLEYSESTRDWRTHDGADYAGKAGDAVRAIADGTVVEIGEDAMHGKYVVLSHAQDMTSLYAGLDKIEASEGDAVKGGAQLAVLGTPMPLEEKQGVHLHLAVTKAGKAVDPAGLF